MEEETQRKTGESSPQPIFGGLYGKKEMQDVLKAKVTTSGNQLVLVFFTQIVLRNGYGIVGDKNRNGVRIIVEPRPKDMVVEVK